MSIKEPKVTETLWDHEIEGESGARQWVCRGKKTFNLWFMDYKFASIDERKYDPHDEVKSSINFMKTTLRYFLKQFVNKNQEQEILFKIVLTYQYKYKGKVRRKSDTLSCNSCWVSSNKSKIIENFDVDFCQAINSLTNDFNSQIRALGCPIVKTSCIGLYYKTKSDHENIIKLP